MALRLTPISPAALAAGNNNDYAGISTKSVARLSADAGGSTLTGIAAGGDGDVIVIVNVSANTLTIANQDANSAAANRIITGTGANIAMAADDTVQLVYDATTQRWRVMNSH